jgi:acetyltransferase-like isoleucine patch superfamily enzyme
MKSKKLFILFKYFLNFIIVLFPGKTFKKFRNSLWNLQGYKIDSTANIMPSVKIICGEISIGEDTFIGEEVMITGGIIRIDNKCDIAPRVTIHAGSHKISDFKRRAGEPLYGAINIGEGTWVGASSTIINGARIGKGVIVAAGSVVIKGDYPDNTLIGGSPAKIIKYFD